MNNNYAFIRKEMWGRAPPAHYSTIIPAARAFI